MDFHPDSWLNDNRSEQLLKSRNRKGGCEAESSDGSRNYKRVRRECDESTVSCQCTQSKCAVDGVVCNELLKFPLSKGEQVKKLGNVVQMRLRSRKKQPNIVCRIECFGRVCEHFDNRRRRWVGQMGFGGLLHLAGLTLPHTLCYWLMTRVNPYKETIVMNDGVEVVLNANQVRWVLGLPFGGKAIPRKTINDEMKMRERSIMLKYGKERHGVVKGTGKQIHSKGVTISDSVIENLKGEWSEDDEEEFKTSFLLFSLYMVLCPTQSVCLESDLIPAVNLASRALEYDWCSLVFEKFMGSVKRFSKKFDDEGYVGGCGGCSIFVALYYLDRLDRKPVHWDVCPRVKAWSNQELRKGTRDDRFSFGGDFGKLKSVAASYGETHPLESGDKCAPDDDKSET